MCIFYLEKVAKFESLCYFALILNICRFFICWRNLALHFDIFNFLSCLTSLLVKSFQYLFNFLLFIRQTMIHFPLMEINLLNLYFIYSRNCCLSLELSILNFFKSISSLENYFKN